MDSPGAARGGRAGAHAQPLQSGVEKVHCAAARAHEQQPASGVEREHPEGRGVSNQYGARDAACPISTG